MGSLGTRVGSKPLRLLVLAETFPSRIQPWLLSSIEQAVRRGAEVYIAARRRRGQTHQKKVDSLGLLARTLYVDTDLLGLLHGLARLFDTQPGPLRQVWRGLFALAAHPRYLNPGLKNLLRAIPLSVVAGLENIDLIQAHSLSGAYDYLPIKRLFGTPLVLTFHGRTPSGVPRLACTKMGEVFAYADRILVNTDFAKKQVVALGAEAAKIRKIPQGIGLTDYPFSFRQMPEDGVLRLVSVGRLQPDKGHSYAIEAVRLLRDRGYRVSYRIVGTGPSRAQLLSAAESLGISDAVSLVGEVSDDELLKELKDAQIFLFPSIRDSEGFHEETQGYAIQEAQSTGLIVVVTNTGGIPECVDAGRSAFVVPDKNSKAIADAVQHIADSPTRWHEWQLTGHRWVEKNFSASAIGDKLWAQYLDLIATRHP